MTKQLIMILVSTVLTMLVVGCETEDFAVYPTGMAVISIPAGEFEMGSSSNPVHPDEEPLHLVKLDAFGISQTEVTNLQYVQFLNEAMENGLITVWGDGVYDYRDNYVGNLYLELRPENLLVSETTSHIDYEDETFSVEPDYADWPVIKVSWYGALAFTTFFNEFHGTNMRLPTEAEWEYVAKGGLDYVYPTEDGTINCENANYMCGADTIGHVTEVDSYSRNPFNLSDLAGNVKEWCWDRYDSDFYFESSEENPVNVSEEELLQGGTENEVEYSIRVVRGGSYLNSEDSQRSAFRGLASPLNVDYYTGFRIVVDE